MKRLSVNRRRGGRFILALAVVVAFAAALAARPAQAYIESMHGGITTCDPCHLNNHTLDPPVNEFCITCHGDFEVRDQSLRCWTCHAPGQDMSAMRGDATCVTTCHLFDGTTITHQAHADRSTTCSDCHVVSTSTTEANGSAHHTGAPPLPPMLTGFSPTQAVVGEKVTLTGMLMSGATEVTFNGMSATQFTEYSSTKIVATVPTGATSGAIAVVTSRGTSTSIAAFTVVVPPVPTVVAIAPLSGLEGSTVTLIGTGFTGATAVSFAGTAAAVFTVISDARLDAVVPAGAVTGTIAVTTPNGSGLSATVFTVVDTSRVTLRVRPDVVVRGTAVKATGVLTPADAGSRTVTLRVQRRKNGLWALVKTAHVPAGLTGSYVWKYVPARRGAYRLKAKVVATATATAATTRWAAFRVQ